VHQFHDVVPLLFLEKTFLESYNFCQHVRNFPWVMPSYQL